MTPQVPGCTFFLHLDTQKRIYLRRKEFLLFANTSPGKVGIISLCLLDNVTIKYSTNKKDVEGHLFILFKSYVLLFINTRQPNKQ